jgi:glycolate oxidase FAD binding subunit
MKISADALRAKLAAELGAGSLDGGLDAPQAHAVDGKIPSLVCLPTTPEEIAAVLRVCGEADAAVAPWGGGTSIRLGNIPRRLDVVIGLEKLAKLIEHDDANLTATVQAGMTLAALQEVLAGRRQCLPLDPPHPARATIGGIIAANVNGPRRMMYGAVRDLVVGMKMVLATGERVKTGGKVVKNVAGYDLAKLFIGSLGTLGVITEATFKMAPLPETAVSFVASGPPARTAQFVAELSRSPLLPAAVTFFSPGSVDSAAVDLPTPGIAVWVEGFDAAVDRHLRDLEAMAGRAGIAARILRDESHRRLWEEIRDFGADDTGVLFRLTVSTGAVAEMLGGLSRAVAEGGRYVAHAPSGAIHLAINNGDGDGLNWFARLADMAGKHQGNAVMAAAPAALKQDTDVWGPAQPGLRLMREIKRRFDPQEILNPGRFVAGL